jgi:hypothetical protein
MDPTLPLTLIYIRDLLFSSKVVATARAEDVPFKVVRDAPKLIETPAARLIVDLNAEGALETAIVWHQRHGRPVIGFVAHVAGDRILAAKEAGIAVMTNGSFTARLPQILSAIRAETPPTE